MATDEPDSKPDSALSKLLDELLRLLLFLVIIPNCASIKFIRNIAPATTPPRSPSRVNGSTTRGQQSAPYPDPDPS